MPLSTLFLDLNSYFASVEQQLQPHLRGKPVAVVPVDTDYTCCIAASYEAKRFGIKTGTGVREAKALCPELRVVVARTERYVEMHHTICAAVEACLPVQGVLSIDELFCRLGAREQNLEAGQALARRVKQAIYRQAGECLRCSIGLAPNRFLAKVASDMQKPDGLVALQEHELPQRLFALQLTDLPGIGPRMEARLRGQGVHSVEELCKRSEGEMERLWRGIVGRRWWHVLRGQEIYEAPTRRRSVGHQHVLPPELREPEQARGVLVRLLSKAAARARHLGCRAGGMAVWMRYVDGRVWNEQAGLGQCRNTLDMARAFADLWPRRFKGAPLMVGVTLYNLSPDRGVPEALFFEERKRERLARAVDGVNARHGANALYLAAMHSARDSAPARIAFSSIPDLTLNV
ncbi:MAG: DNA polymerase [Planctomycetes bacterium]|nr:DNA polymerase [Planctomycetota bacterium]